MRFYEDKYQALLEKNVTAVFAVSDFYALEFMRFLQGKNIRIPKDIQIIGLNDKSACMFRHVSEMEKINSDAISPWFIPTFGQMVQILNNLII